MIINAVKSCLENMNEKFVDLSRMKFDKLRNELKEHFLEQKVQERPFAYEFYHQFRKLWDSGSIPRIASEDVVIQAEVNKIYQSIPNLGKIPDFLLHEPSTNENLAVIEFKVLSNSSNISSDISRIKKDFEKLVAFKHKLEYRHLIEVIVGDENLLRKARERILPMNNTDGEEIIVIEFNTNSWRANDYKIKYKGSLA
ncbi:MAG: hypothetical protein ACTSP1_13140 [Candidatus Freyarchaeota archaeon]